MGAIIRCFDISKSKRKNKKILDNALYEFLENDGTKFTFSVHKSKPLTLAVRYDNLVIGYLYFEQKEEAIWLIFKDVWNREFVVGWEDYKPFVISRLDVKCAILRPYKETFNSGVVKDI